jgi:hypothetical protein
MKLSQQINMPKSSWVISRVSVDLKISVFLQLSISIIRVDATLT